MYILFFDGAPSLWYTKPLIGLVSSTL